MVKGYRLILYLVKTTLYLLLDNELKGLPKFVILSHQDFEVIK